MALSMRRAKVVVIAGAFRLTQSLTRTLQNLHPITMDENESDSTSMNAADQPAMNKSLHDDDEGDTSSQDVLRAFIEGREDDAALVERIFQESINDDTDEGYKEVEYGHRTGRVTKLSMGTTLAAPMDPIEHYWDLSPTITQLKDLESLTLTCCKSIPAELGKLRNLKQLTLITCKKLESFPENLFQNHDEATCLSQLEELRVVGIISISPPNLKRQVAPLKCLKVLQFSFCASSVRDELSYLSQLAIPEVQFRESLPGCRRSCDRPSARKKSLGQPASSWRRAS